MKNKKRWAKYEFIHDGTYSYIRYLDDHVYTKHKVDNDYFFYSHKKAQRALIRYFKCRSLDYKMAYQNAKKEFKNL